jgi:hypothetical protein
VKCIYKSNRANYLERMVHFYFKDKRYRRGFTIGKTKWFNISFKEIDEVITTL